MIPFLIAAGGVTLFVWYFANECCPHKATPVTGLDPTLTHEPVRSPKPTTPQPQPTRVPPKGPTLKPGGKTADQSIKTQGPKPSGKPGGPLDALNNFRQGLAKQWKLPEWLTGPEAEGPFDANTPKSFTPEGVGIGGVGAFAHIDEDDYYYY